MGRCMTSFRKTVVASSAWFLIADKLGCVSWVASEFVATPSMTLFTGKTRKQVFIFYIFLFFLHLHTKLYIFMTITSDTLSWYCIYFE